MSDLPRTAAAPWPAVSILDAHAQLTAPGARFEIEERRIRGHATRTWKNAPATLSDVFQNGRRFGEREFLVYEDERVTFESFARATVVLARQLADDGVRKGDRVAVVMRNLPEWPVAFWAGVLCGAIVTPLNAWWTGAELEYGLADCGAKAAIVDAERLGRLAGRIPATLERIYVTRDEVGVQEGFRDGLVQRLESVIGRPGAWAALPDQPAPEIELASDDDATILYTSGTTGAPKGALGTHRNMTSNIMTSALSAARNALRAGLPPAEDDPALDPQRVTLLVVPMFHATGLSATLSPALNGGGKIVLMHRWAPQAALRLIERERVTATGGVPAIAWQIIEHPARAQYDLSSLQTLSYGGGPAAPELVRRIAEVFPAALPGNGWGMTETTATFTIHVGPDYQARPQSAGPAAPVGEMQVRDPVDGRAVLPIGSVGELWVKGPQVARGYWNKPQATAETFVEGWLRTGDLARIDEEGFLFIVDRLKDMLIRGGENVYCVEVEDVLYDHPEVMDAAVVGLAHKILGEEPAAVVQLRADARATEGELRAWVAGRLATFKVPVTILFWPEPLPRNANGKILKADLKAALEAARRQPAEA
jgi:long-chain acyl-CoA synthetase